MVISFLYLAFVRVVQLVRLLCRAQDDLAIEIVMLRHEVAVLRRQVDRPALRPADRALFAGLSRLLSRARRGSFVQAATLLGWHRDLVRRRWATHTADPVDPQSLHPLLTRVKLSGNGDPPSPPASAVTLRVRHV